jgi:gas vesicle protein
MNPEDGIHMDNENGAAGAIGWFVCGALLGAGAALLLAPEAGKHTRRRIAKQATRGKKSFLRSSQDALSRGRELFEKGREIADEAADLFERGRKVAEKTIEDRL